MTSFSVLNTILAEDDQSRSIENFQFKADQWKKQVRRTRINRRNQKYQTQSDQQILPAYTHTEEKEVNTRQETDSDEKHQETATGSDTQTLSLDKQQLELFSLVNQQNFPLYFVPRQNPRPPQPQPRPPPNPQPQPAQQPYYAQQMRPQIPLQRPFTPQSSQYNQPPASQNQNDDSNHTIDYESFFIKNKQAHNTQQQQRQENDTKFLLNQFNNRANFPYNPNYYKSIPNFQDFKNYTFLQQMRQSVPQAMPQQQMNNQQLQQQPSPQILKIYFNQYADHNQWSVMWDPEQCPNIPLILDRSDRRIKFTDVNDQKTGNRRMVKQWSDMNLENRDFYSELLVLKDSRLDLNLQHSDPALRLSLIEPNITDFENFHKPKFNTEKVQGHKLLVTFKPETDNIDLPDGIAISPFIKDLKGLSGKKGGVVAVEHTSEFPPFILNIGMASRLITYWHKATPTDLPKTNDENLHILEPDQTAPFIAQIPRNEPVPSLNCKLFSVPVGEHQVETTDFLLVKSMVKTKFYIRRFGPIYCAGYPEPRQVVMRPATKTAQDFHMDFIKAILINVFRGTEQYPGRRRIQVSHIQQEFFPGVNDPKLRTVLRGFAKFYREQNNGYWERKDVNLDQQFDMIEITPEMVCNYQSMLVGQWRLRQAGVNILTRSKRVFQQIQRLKGELTKRVAGKIELELMKTPWARTDNFSKAFQGHAVQIEHTEDGQQIMRSKSRRGKSESGEGKESTTARRQLAGTDSDLRALTLRELREKLLALGVPSQHIDEISRWKQVDLLRKLANRQKEDGNNTDVVQNFSRGPRNDHAASLEAYKKQYQQTFENNLAFINTTNPIGSDDNFDDGNILDDLSLQMMRDTGDDDENDIDINEVTGDEGEKKSTFVSKGDPPELVPYGVCVSPTKIDWSRFGYGNYPMRKVAKLITIAWTNEGVRIDVHWRRSPHQIEALKKNTSNVYLDQGQKSPSNSEDIEEYILKITRKSLLDKIRRTRQAMKTRSPKTMVQAYIAVHHQLPIVNDKAGPNNLVFSLTPEIMQKIAEASERFSVFEKRTGRSHSKKKKNANDKNSEDESEGENEVTTVPKRRIARKNPVVIFNDLLKKLLNKLLKRPGDEFWPFKKPILKKDIPDYLIYVQKPMCFEDVERKCNNLEYTTIAHFYADVKLIDSNCHTYNSNRNEDLVILSDRMMSEFQKELAAMRDELDQTEQEIDPVLKNTENVI